MIRLRKNQLNIPENYFTLSEEEKHDTCLGLLETIYDMIIKTKDNQINKVELFNKIIDTTLEHHINTEDYEVCALLSDTKRILNDAATDHGLHK